MRNDPATTTRAVQMLLEQHTGWLRSLLAKEKSIKQSSPNFDHIGVDEDAFLTNIKFGHTSTVRKKLRSGQFDARLEVRVHGKPLLNQAADAKNSEIMGLLIQYGAKAWIRSKSGNEFFVETMKNISGKNLTSKPPGNIMKISINSTNKSILVHSVIP
jgi:hypothetical protein